jgi:hypothetical protein
METVILTATLYAVTLRYRSNSEDDIALTNAMNFLLLNGFEVGPKYDHDVNGSSDYDYMIFTRAVPGGDPPDPLVDPELENVTFVDATPA